MARPLRIQYPGAVYHVTHRGNERKPIFRDNSDRNNFLKILAQSKETYDIFLHSFVLMNNHFHFLVETPLGNLSEFMRHFNITYTSYFNRKHRRSGNLYQGRFKSFLVEKETYLSKVSRYVHLNPVRIRGMMHRPLEEQLQHLFSYTWSSLPGFTAIGKRLDFMEYRFVLEEFGGDTRNGRAAYKKQIAADIQEGLPVKEKIVAQSILGTDGFIERIKEKYLPERSDRERPSIGRVHMHKAKDELIRIVAEETGDPEKEILHEKGLSRLLAMYVLYRYGGYTNPEIGRMMDIDYSTVSQGRKRLREKVMKDETIKEILQRVEAKCQ